MRVFVTGASGWIGSATVPELLAAGHEVVGLVRSAEQAGRLEAAGAEAVLGTIEDLDVLRRAAAEADGVIHLAFIHDFSDMAHSAGVDRRVIETFGDVLEGSERPLVIASGTLGLRMGDVGLETDRPDLATMPAPRLANAALTLALADRGVRSSVVWLSPTVHGNGDHGFIATLVNIARERGVSGYIGDGANRWSAVHRLDAASLFRLAVEKAPAGTALHGVAEQGVRIRDVAEVIGRKLDLPVVSVPAEEAVRHFTWLGHFLGFDSPASNTITRELLGWDPTGPTLLEDLEAGYYTRAA